MRYKVAPPARSLASLAEARKAIPMVPDSEADCCRAIQDVRDLQTRDEAREILIFLHALGLVDRTDRGYYRTQEPLDREVLADAYRRNVFAVAELLDAIEATPRTAEEAFEAIRAVVPQWERNRHADWEVVWRDRVERLLDWGVAFGLVHARDVGYTLAGQ